MEAKDLRIGNLVKWVDDETQVIPITATRLINFSVGMEDIEPIPLTEEWLMNFGFIIDYDKGCYFKEFNRSCLYIDSEEFIIYIAGDEICTLEYLHQLQNLFFAITGRELERKVERSTCG